MRTALAVLLLAAPVVAQDAVPIEGRWTATWARAVRDHGATVVVQATADAVLELRRDGNDLEGTWTTSFDGPETWAVTGTVKGDEVRLRADSTLDETFLETPRGHRRSSPRPWSARRADPDAGGPDP